MKDQLKMLAQLENLRSLKSQKALAELQAEEMRLRKDLNTLNGHRRQSHAVDLELIPMRAIGADVLWQAWIDRTQADLNVDLARLMVRKEPAVKRASRDIARRDVVADLGAQTIKAESAARSQKSLNDLLELACVQAALGRKT